MFTDFMEEVLAALPLAFLTSDQVGALFFTAAVILAAVVVAGVVYTAKKIRNKPLMGTGSILENTGFAYDQKQDIFYSVMNCWQRKYGYCSLYDEAAPALSMIIDSEPIRFKYEGKNWLIELWKGQYGMTTGGEVGVYTSKGNSLHIPRFFEGIFYGNTNEEDHLEISFKLYKNGKLLFAREGKHWWLTGFVLGEFSEPEQLRMYTKIKLKDADMRDVFVKALRKAGYSRREYKTEGLTVHILFRTPHAPQPKSRGWIIRTLAQRSNKSYCRLYQKLTRGKGNSLERLESLKTTAPKVYAAVLNPFASTKAYSGYGKLQKGMGGKR